MSDFELAYLFMDTVDTLGDLYANFFNFIFAGLVGSALAANRMSRGMAVLAIALFSVIEISAMMQIQRAVVTFASLGLHLKEVAAAPGHDLAWHGVISAPVWAFKVGELLAIPILGGCYLGVIYFFFLCRRGQFSLVNG